MAQFIDPNRGENINSLEIVRTTQSDCQRTCSRPAVSSAHLADDRISSGFINGVLKNTMVIKARIKQ